MRRSVSLLVVSLLIFSCFGITTYFEITSKDATADVGLSGDITQSKTFPVNTNIYIEGDVNIKSGVVVTIQQGSTIQFNSTSSIIDVKSGGSLNVMGIETNHVVFKPNGVASWNSIQIHGTAYTNFTWCDFLDSNNGFVLDSNNFHTLLANCSFNNTGTRFFSLSNSKLDVVSTEFEQSTFDNSTYLNTNLGKINIADESSELFIEYFVDVTAKDGKNTPLKDINVVVSPSGTGKGGVSYSGLTDAGGVFNHGRATALRVNGTSPNENIDFIYSNTVEVNDKWDGNTAKEEPGISRQTYTINNASKRTKNNNLHIEIDFIFDYPPRIDTTFPTKLTVREDDPKTYDFVFHDNDDYTTGTQMNYNQFDGITIHITDKNGVDIYDDGSAESTKQKWVSWSPNYGGKLIFSGTTCL